MHAIVLQALAEALFSVRTNTASKTFHMFWQITDRDKTHNRESRLALELAKSLELVIFCKYWLLCVLESSHLFNFLNVFS